MEVPPPSYEEAMKVDSGKASGKLQQTPFVMPLATLHENPSAVVWPSTAQFPTASESTVMPYPIAVQPTDPAYSAALHPTSPRYSSDATHEVAIAQPTGTDFSREDEATIVNEALHISLKYPRCFNCFMGLAAKPLPPTLRKAWAMGLKIAVKTATIGNIPRYLFLAVQSTLVVIAIVLSSIAINTSSFGDNVASYACVGSLCLVILINSLERFICGCSHAVARSDSGGTWNFCADIIRTTVTEIVLYFAFMITLQGVTTSDSYQAFFSEKSVNSSVRELSLGIGFTLLGVIGVAFVLTAGVMHMYLIVFAVKSLLQARKFNNSTTNLSTKAFLYGFCIYTSAQCVTKALLIVFAGIYFHEAAFFQESLENRGTFSPGLKWYFAILAELIPFSGLFLYFITTQKLVEEFPIAFLLDASPPSQDRRENISMGVVTLQFKALHSKNMSKTGILENIFYPLTSPAQVLVYNIFFFLCLNYVQYLLIVSFPSHISFQIVSTMAVVLTLVLDFLPLVYGFVSLILCEVFGCILCPLFIFSCIEPNAIRDISVKHLF